MKRHAGIYTPLRSPVRRLVELHGTPVVVSLIPVEGGAMLQLRVRRRHRGHLFELASAFVRAEAARAGRKTPLDQLELFAGGPS